MPARHRAHCGIVFPVVFVRLLVVQAWSSHGTVVRVENIRSDEVQSRKHAVLVGGAFRHSSRSVGTGANVSSTMVHQNRRELIDKWPGLLMATLAGFSTVLGALCILCMPAGGPPPVAMAFALALAAGVMLAVSAEVLLPHEHHHESDGHDHDHGHGHEHEHGHEEPVLEWRSIGIFALSFLVTLVLCKVGDIAHAASHSAMNEATKSDTPTEGLGQNVDEEQKQSHRNRLAVLLFCSLTAHNLPEGFAVAASTLSGNTLCVSICLAIAFHNIPEGVALAVSTFDATKSQMQSILVPLYSGLAEPIGALIAILLLEAYTTPQLIKDLMAGVAGIMCCIALAELVPEALATHEYVSTFAGLASGILVMHVTHEVMEAYGGGHAH